MENVLKRTEERMTKSVQNMENEFAMIRAGRANPKLLDKIVVSYYGSETPLQQVANISVPEARVILIQPWDKTMIKEINKALLASDIGITPSDDGQAIRLVFPELTGERRQELCKEVKKKAEDAKVALRNIRRDALEELKKMQKATEITEDDLKTGETKIQKTIDNFTKAIEDALAKKEKEITTV